MCCYFACYYVSQTVLNRKLFFWEAECVIYILFMIILERRENRDEMAKFWWQKLWFGTRFQLGGKLSSLHVTRLFYMQHNHCITLNNSFKFQNFRKHFTHHVQYVHTQHFFKFNRLRTTFSFELFKVATFSFTAFKFSCKCVCGAD